jgi:hypothetical protein
VKKLCILIVVFLTSCSTISKDPLGYELVFGTLEKSNTINPTNIIFWKKGSVENPYGVYIRRIKPIEYELSFTVSRYDSKLKKKVLIEKCGDWIIRPPNNSKYSALITHIFDNEVEFGEYIFDVYVDNKLAKSFVYYVVPPNG